MSRPTHVVDGKKQIDLRVGVIMPSHYLHGVFHAEVDVWIAAKGDYLEVELIVRDRNSQKVHHFSQAFLADRDLHVTEPRRPR